jgi:hypothetical protein
MISEFGWPALVSTPPATELGSLSGGLHHNAVSSAIRRSNLRLQTDHAPPAQGVVTVRLGLNPQSLPAFRCVRSVLCARLLLRLPREAPTSLNRWPWLKKHLIEFSPLDAPGNV